MKPHYNKNATVVYIPYEESGQVIEAIRNAKKTIHKLTSDIEIGDIPGPSRFNPAIPVSTAIGMLFIESDGPKESLLFLVGGFSFDMMGINK